MPRGLCSPAAKVLLEVAQQVLPKGPRLLQAAEVVPVAIHPSAARVGAEVTQRALHPRTVATVHQYRGALLR
jgi:hypothetical protein